MDDHHPQYGVPELRQLMQGGGRVTTTESPSTSSHFPSDFFGFNLAPAAPPPPQQHHRLHQFTTDQEMGFLPRGIHGLGGSSSTAGNNSNLNASSSGGAVGFGGEAVAEEVSAAVEEEMVEERGDGRDKKP